MMVAKGKIVFLFMAFLWIADSNAFVVLLDPGHGGHEFGATKNVRIKSGQKVVVEKVYEKDLSLSLAKRIRDKLEPRYVTYLTRSIDRSVGLNERAQMAETVKADLFISIHFNSSDQRRSHGFETFYLDNHKDAAVNKVEDIENQHIEGEDKIVNQILIDLVIQKTVDSSKKLAAKVHSQIRSRIKRPYKMKDRGIKPGLFYVLALSKRPGLLVEAGFMSNDKEIWKLRRGDFLDSYAQAIADGIDEYFKDKAVQNVPLF